MKRLLRNDGEIKRALKTGHAKTPVRKDPFKTDAALKRRLDILSNEIDDLARKRNMYALDACILIENKIRTLLYRINARSRTAAEKHRLRHWAIAKDVKAHCYEYGQISVELIGHWNDGSNFDENLSHENFDYDLLKHLSSEYGIHIGFDSSCFGK